MAAKAATKAKPTSSGSKSAKKKKWSKAKAKDVANNAVIFDKATLDKLKKEVPAYKLITPSVLVDRLRVNGSLARRALRELAEQGAIRLVSSHGSQLIYTRSIAGAAAAEAAEAEAAKAPKAAKAGKGKKAAAAADEE
ncbi:hypothetical protein GQ42DRAFT_161625 [Ramicandelaber brevisporus]|nr:hypothetical protein GQ42DRAFT_161625 [Ramicandelaber brevisporus]